jgi:hypothetical protein
LNVEISDGSARRAWKKRKRRAQATVIEVVAVFFEEIFKAQF